MVAVEEGTHLEDALGEFAPEGQDRTLSWFLAYGVQRHRGRVDASLREHLRQPLAALDAPVRAVLRIGAFEKLFARTKPHAVVHQAVEVSRRLKVGRASGMVNAVLRRVGPPAAGALSRSEGLDHPAWLVDRWTERFGTEVTDAWCLANGEPPPVFVVERSPGAVAANLGEFATPVERAGQFIPGVFRVEHSGAVTTWPGFEQGAFWVQDLAAVAAADTIPVHQGTRVLDACAAPGGKAFRLMSRGAKVVAIDRDDARLQHVRQGTERLGFELDASHVHDWATGPLPELGTFDAVLVDAPCTGLGTVRRHPEIRWRRVEADLAGAARRQGIIVAAAARHVAPGGVLVYSVCSPEPEEGLDVVNAFVASSPFEMDTTWCSAPPAQGEDAHFAARMMREGS